MANGGRVDTEAVNQTGFAQLTDAVPAVLLHQHVFSQRVVRFSGSF